MQQNLTLDRSSPIVASRDAISLRDDNTIQVVGHVYA